MVDETVLTPISSHGTASTPGMRWSRTRSSQQLIDDRAVLCLDPPGQVQER
jgi:hypothetical protein